jgi:hypothetical protein
MRMPFASPIPDVQRHAELVVEALEAPEIRRVRHGDRGMAGQNAGELFVPRLGPRPPRVDVQGAEPFLLGDQRE